MTVARRVPARAEPLAIVGIGCRVPGASGPRELWSLLRRGADVVGPRPERSGGADIYDRDPFAAGKSVSRFGSFLDDVGGVDWRFFGISPREARSIDPQHRLLLEVAWEALEDAGMPVSRAAGAAGRRLHRYHAQRLRTPLREGPCAPSTGTRAEQHVRVRGESACPFTSTFAVRASRSTRIAADRSWRFTRLVGAWRPERRTGPWPAE